MASFNYSTVEGDRVDNLSQRFYGGQYGISILLDANPFIQIEAIFPIGTVLVVPIIESEQVIDNSLLPPWKR